VQPLYPIGFVALTGKNNRCGASCATITERSARKCKRFTVPASFGNVGVMSENMEWRVIV
jgi:hypothetical protein